MSKQAADDRSKLIELSELQLDNVAGGTKVVDKSSPNIFLMCANGKHIQQGK
jgi:type VI protein secretion system component Hcp